MSGHARLSVFNNQGQRLCDYIMTKLTLKLGRQDSDVSMDTAESDKDCQILKLSPELTGVSRVHASISWSEKDLAFKIDIVGRNGATVNHRKLSLNESSILSPKQVSTIALGKSCFIYFCPAVSNKKQLIASASPRATEDSNATRKPVGIRWQPAAIKEFQRRETQTMDLNELLNCLGTTYAEHCESSTSWRKTVRQLVRKLPFSFDDVSQLVTLT